jgi:signal peptidase I
MQFCNDPLVAIFSPNQLRKKIQPWRGVAPMSNEKGADSKVYTSLPFTLDGPSRKGTLGQGFRSFFIAVFVIMAVRWLLWEPYLIPSGSMIPTFLINDHILVNKFRYGVRIPFTSQWIFRFKSPQRGEVIVFRSKEDPDFFMIKRVVAVAGDEVEYVDGTLKVNGEAVSLQDSAESFSIAEQDFNGPGTVSDYTPIRERVGTLEYMTLLRQRVYHKEVFLQKVPEGELFVMGDNRDNSNDSRFWGTVSVDNVLGKAMFVWLSCVRSAESVSFACSAKDIRWGRFFHLIH